MICGGIIGSYDPDSRMYGVNVDVYGDRLARRLHTGVDKPFPVGTRVVCFKSETLSWIILGEVDMPQPEMADNRQKNVDEAAADLIEEIARLRPTSELGDKSNYRRPNDQLHFAGDVSLENRVEDPRSRSRVKIYSFGAILTFASNFCFQLFDRKENQILMQARNFLKRCIGYMKSIRTDSATQRTTIQEKVQSAVLEKNSLGQSAPRTDRLTVEGYIPWAGARATTGADIAKKPKVARGRREVFMDHRIEEIDNTTQTRRVRQDKVTYDADNQETARVQEIVSVEGNLQNERLTTAQAGSVTMYRDWLKITVDSPNQTVHIHDLKNNQTIILDTAGVSVTAKSFTVNSPAINLKGGFVSITGSSILIDSPNTNIPSVPTLGLHNGKHA